MLSVSPQPRLLKVHQTPRKGRERRPLRKRTKQKTAVSPFSVSSLFSFRFVVACSSRYSACPFAERACFISPCYVLRIPTQVAVERTKAKKKYNTSKGATVSLLAQSFRLSVPLPPSFSCSPFRSDRLAFILAFAALQRTSRTEKV